MYHPFNKNSSYVRNALIKVYRYKCVYCSEMLQLRDMHVDHILPTNMAEQIDNDISNYINELSKRGFVQDSLENYLPSCANCNIRKGNTVYEVSNLRYFHELARKNVPKLLELIEKEKQEREYYYSPVDFTYWTQVDFKYQRGINYAIMGYRLNHQDVNSCPVFPQVSKIEKQLKLVDYVFIQGESGCGKSISLFQVAAHYHQTGWKVYSLKNNNASEIVLPENTENTLYLIDDAQIYRTSLIDSIVSQSRPNRKVLLSRTVTENISAEDIMLTNRDSIDALYRDFLRRKDEIWPIVKECDPTIGINVMDIQIEDRLQLARKSSTPWQFTYALRGGWNTMRDLYLAVSTHHQRDLLVALIATLQILNLDQAINFDYLNNLVKRNNPRYGWTKDDLQYLVDKRIVLSTDDVRIIHLESAFVVVSLFFERSNTDKRDLLLAVIENEFNENEISPMGIVWLCNGCSRRSKNYDSIEAYFLTESILNSLEKRLQEAAPKEKFRDVLYLLEKTINVERSLGRGFSIFKRNEELLAKSVSGVNSVTAWAFGELFNTLYNHDKEIYRWFAMKIHWNEAVDNMVNEEKPDYSAWGYFFERGLSLAGRRCYSKYNDNMIQLMEQIANRASETNIKQISSCMTSLAFINLDKTFGFISNILPIYQEYFKKDLREAIHIFDFNFLCYICGLNFWGKQKPLPEQKRIAETLIDAIPNEKLAEIISTSILKEWYSIRDVLFLIITYNHKKYESIIGLVDLEQLSACVKYSWSHSHEITMIIAYFMEANCAIAKSFIEMNRERIQNYFALLVAIDTEYAIEANMSKGIKLELFSDERWKYIIYALKALKKENREFTADFLNNCIAEIVTRYNKVTALDFKEKYPLELLRLINCIDSDVYQRIVASINVESVLDNWEKCGGIGSRERPKIEKRKIELLEILNG